MNDPLSRFMLWCMAALGLMGLGFPQGQSTDEKGAQNLGSERPLWEQWWRLQERTTLPLREAAWECAVVSGDCFFVEPTGEVTDALRPSLEQLREEAIPGLLRVIESEGNPELLSAAVLTLGQMGERSHQPALLQAQLVPFLASAHDTLAENATLALGLLGHEPSAPLLIDLMLDTSAGRRRAAHEAEVPIRRRVFAAYALGLLGKDCESNSTRQRIVASLVDILNARHFATPDLKVAALLSIGLVKLDYTEESSDLAGTKLAAASAYPRSLTAQICYLLDILDPARERTHRATQNASTRAHTPVPLAKLYAALPAQARSDWKTRIASRLLAILELDSMSDGRPRTRDEERRSSVIALGMIADCDEDQIDVRIRARLMRSLDDSDDRVAAFAHIALSQVGSRGGGGRRAFFGLESIQNEFLLRLSDDTSAGPFAALAVGVLSRGRSQRGFRPSAKLSQALLRATRKCSDHSAVGAFALAIGAGGEDTASEILFELHESLPPDNRAHDYTAVALGMSGDRTAFGTFRITEDPSSSSWPELETRLVALVLLGDKTLVPELIHTIRESKSGTDVSILIRALGLCGDARAVTPLLKMIQDRNRTLAERTLAATALGNVCDPRPKPWTFAFANGLAPPVSIPTLFAGDGTGLIER